MRACGIARASLHRPRLLVLDEPTVRLDIKSRADIVGYVRRLVVEDGVSVLWATHLIDEVSDDDDVIVLHQGRRSEEHTSELQSQSNLVCRLLLEKKKR